MSSAARPEHAPHRAPDSLPDTSTDSLPDYRASGWWRDETVMDDLRRAVAAHPDRAALICYQQDTTVVLSYRELAARVERIAANLVRLGIRPAEVVTLHLPNSWELVALCLACVRAGAVPGPVVPIMRRREVEFMTRLTASPMYIAPAHYRGLFGRQLGREVAAAVTSLRHQVVVAGPALPGQTSLAAGDTSLDFERDLLLADPGPVDLDARESRADDPGQIMFTSGTTGEPKGVVHTHNTLYAMNKAQADVLHLGPDEVTAMGSPTTHQAGYTWNFLMPLQLGATAVQVDAWNPEVMLDALQDQKVTFFMGAPTFLSDLIEAQRARPRDLSALHTFATGSAPIAPSLVEDALEVLGCRVYALWGMSENGCVTITRPEQEPLRAAHSDGVAVPGMQVRIVDEDGQAVSDGRAGALQVRGASQCEGYFMRPDVYAASLTPDGWFETGDLARDDGYGGIRITGRVKDLIMRGAENIPAVEVEASLLRMPNVRDVAVVAYPDDRLGERACAVLVPQDEPPTLQEVQAHLSLVGMAKNYWPERLEVVSALPRTPSGKIQKFALREQLREAS